MASGFAPDKVLRILLNSQRDIEDETRAMVLRMRDIYEKEETMADKTVWKPLSTPLPDDAPSRIKVDWQELSEKNNDLAAWILTPDADYLYKICSIHQASSGSDTFIVRFADYEEYKLWQDKMFSLSAPS